jgi:hypothetical protein
MAVKLEVMSAIPEEKEKRKRAAERILEEFAGKLPS